MDNLEIKKLVSESLHSVAEAIRDNNAETVDHLAYKLDKEIDEEVKHRRIVAERRNPRTVWEVQKRTGMGLYTCKNALEGADWDINKALEILRRN